MMASPGPNVGCAATSGTKGAFIPDGISAEALSEYLSSRPDEVLLIDARPYSDYLVGHIAGALSVRLSSLMTRRLCKGTNKLYDLVIQEQKQRYADVYANPASQIVLYESKSPATIGEPCDLKNPIYVILKSLIGIEKRCSFLLGGFNAFKEKFPNLLRIPDVVVNPTIPVFPSMHNLEEPLSATMLSGASPTPFWGGDSRESESARRKKILSITPSEILPHLIIGSKRDAGDKALLDRLGIKYIVNATPDCPCHFQDELSYLRLAVKDCWNQNLPAHFKDAFDFINRARSDGGKAMVHCNAGISRSAAIAIAYVMAEESQPLKEAYSFVKSKRPVISPNLDFMGELQQFEKTLAEDAAASSKTHPPPSDVAVPNPMHSDQRVPVSTVPR
eukprot:m.188847 g.188847  ORF g.188847 m.188847 type:complete len:390 (-) comp18528_c0_seq43:2967-4136(-)